MTHYSSEGANRRPPPNQFAPGDRIRIASGKLQGLTGVIAELPNRPENALAIDGWPVGIYLLVAGADVEPLPGGEKRG
jgi:hypothetical protein